MCERCGYDGSQEKIKTITLFKRDDGPDGHRVGIHAESEEGFEEFVSPDSYVSANDLMMVADYFAKLGNNYALVAISLEVEEMGANMTEQDFLDGKFGPPDPDSSFN